VGCSSEETQERGKEKARITQTLWRTIKMVSFSFKRVKYIILNMIIATGAFLIVYWIWINMMPQDFDKLAMIFWDSILTGLGGSLIARWIAGYDTFKLKLQFWLGNILKSLIYAVFVWLGILGIMLSGEFDFVRFVIIAASASALITFAAYKMSKKFTEAIKDFIG
jgi:hypothetical protein